MFDPIPQAKDLAHDYLERETTKRETGSPVAERLSPQENHRGFLPPKILDQGSRAPAKLMNLLDIPVSNTGVFEVKP